MCWVGFICLVALATPVKQVTDLLVIKPVTILIVDNSSICVGLSNLMHILNFIIKIVGSQHVSMCQKGLDFRGALRKMCVSGNNETNH